VFGLALWEEYTRAILSATIGLPRVLVAYHDLVANPKHFSGQGDRLNGVFSIGGSYKPLQFTEVLLDAYRRDQNSIVLTDQNYTTTGFALGVRQAFLVNYAASLTGGFDHLTYHPTDPTVTATRKDDYFFARAAVDWRARDRLTAGISYLYRKNNSSTGVFSFDNHQIGLNLAYQF